MLDHSSNTYSIRIQPEIGSKYSPVRPHTHEGFGSTKEANPEYAGALDHAPAHKRTKSQAKYGEQASSESSTSFSSSLKQTSRECPLVTSLNANGSKSLVEHRDVSAETEEALIGQTANKLAPKAAIPEIRKDNNGTHNPNAFHDSSVANIWKGRLLGPMEPMQLSKSRTSRHSFADEKPHVARAYTGSSPFGLPIEDPGLESTSVPADNQSKKPRDPKSVFSQTIERDNERNKIPHLSEDLTLANAVATESRRPLQEPQRFRDGKGEEYPNMLADMYSETANGPYLRFLNPSSNSNGTAGRFSRFSPMTTDGFTEVAQAPRPSISQYSSGDARFRYTCPSNILSPTMFPVPETTNPIKEPYHHSSHQHSHQPQLQNLPKLQNQPQLQNHSQLQSQPQLHSQSSLVRELHKPSFDPGNLRQHRNDPSSPFSLPHINHMPLSHAGSLHQPMSTAAYPVLLSVGPMVPTQIPQHVPQLPIMSNPQAERTPKAQASTQPSGNHHSTTPAPPQTNDRIFHCTHPGCEWSFARSSDQKRHIRSHLKPSLRCPYWELEATCNRKGGLFYRLDVLKRHLKLVHMSRPTNGSSDGGHCRICMKNFSTTRDFINHCEECARKAHEDQSLQIQLPPLNNS